LASAYIDEARYSDHERNYDPSERTASDVAGRKQHTRTFVAFPGQLDFGQISVAEFNSQVTIYQPANHSTDKDWA
jgi:hypothetical protein